MSGVRLAVAAGAGALFGLGLLVSGMTDAERVRGFLRLLGPGPWQPELAFVMGGAILPMAAAWIALRRRGAPALGGAVPPPPGRPDAPLLTGAVLFGAGWGLVGLCPGPALAALLWGGWPVALFAGAMAAGMVLTPPLRSAIGAPA